MLGNKKNTHTQAHVHTDKGFVQCVHLKIDLCHSKLIRAFVERRKELPIFWKRNLQCTFRKRDCKGHRMRGWSLRGQWPGWGGCPLICKPHLAHRYCCYHPAPEKFQGCLHLQIPSCGVSVAASHFQNVPSFHKSSDQPAYLLTWLSRKETGIAVNHFITWWRILFFLFNFSMIELFMSFVHLLCPAPKTPSSPSWLLLSAQHSGLNSDINRTRNGWIASLASFTCRGKKSLSS